jgi:hypothetical protein
MEQYQHNNQHVSFWEQDQQGTQLFLARIVSKIIICNGPVVSYLNSKSISLCGAISAHLLAVVDQDHQKSPLYGSTSAKV